MQGPAENAYQYRTVDCNLRNEGPQMYRRNQTRPSLILCRVRQASKNSHGSTQSIRFLSNTGLTTPHLVSATPYPDAPTKTSRESDSRALFVAVNVTSLTVTMPKSPLMAAPSEPATFPSKMTSRTSAVPTTFIAPPFAVAVFPSHQSLADIARHIV